MSALSEEEREVLERLADHDDLRSAKWARKLLTVAEGEG